MQVLWTFDVCDNQSGNALGYMYAQKGQREALKNLGVTFGYSRLAFHHSPPHLFIPLPKTHYNYLYTMYEGYDLPKEFRDKIAKADRIGVPSQDTKEMFVRAGIAKKIDVIPHGVNSQIFPYRKRDGTRKLRFLWLGAPNIRKGYDLVAGAFQKAFKTTDPVELYFKTTPDSWQNDVKFVQTEYDKQTGNLIGTLEKKISEYVINIGNNIIVDCRKVDIDTLNKIYQDAHCFVFPSRGEGFGLTAAEAMSTGCFVITGDKGGQTEFCRKDNSYLVESELKFDIQYGKGKYRCFSPNVYKLADAMQWTFNNWEEAEKRAEAGSKLIRNEFTWENTGKQLYKVLKECDAERQNNR